MNSRERKFLVGGIGAGLLAGAVTLGALVASNAQHAATHMHGQPPTSPAPAASNPAPSDAENVVSSIQLSPDEINAAGVQLAEVHLAKLKTDVDAFGRVEQPEAQLSVIPARVGGRIDRLHVQYTGEKVFRGQPVAELYSPDAASAIEEYRLALQSRERLESARPEAIQQANDLVKASRSRLELWGISETQIDSSGAVAHITIYAPSGGTVVERKVARGQYVNAGDTLFTLADLSTVWVKAEVYESQLPQIRAGQAVELRSDALPNQVVHGKVEFIEPKADPQTRTIPVHVHVANPGMKLVPGMYVRALFTSVAPKDSIVVQRSAVLDTGTRTLVYVASGEGAFEARDIEIGAASGDLYPVLRGLKPGERVVTNGNFLIDSQTRLSGGMTGLFGGSKEFQKQEANGTNGTEPQRQNQPSAKITLSTNPDPPKGAADASFGVTLVDSNGKPIPDATVKVTLVMPAMPAMSMPEMRNSFELPWMAARRVYMGQGNVPMAGSWNVTVEAIRNGAVIASYRTRLSAR
jgi:membrane fusion protein, copper/silver efflux system